MNSITTYPLTEIKSLLQDLGQPAFRAKQLIEWIYLKGASSYDEMTNLPPGTARKARSDLPTFCSSHCRQTNLL